MKKIKLSIMTMAILLSIGGAFATSTRVTQTCQASTQYYFNGGYLLAGQIGVNYTCVTSANTCTYYKVGSTYVPCMTGTYCTSNCRSETTPRKTKN